MQINQILLAWLVSLVLAISATPVFLENLFGLESRPRGYNGPPPSYGYNYPGYPGSGYNNGYRNGYADQPRRPQRQRSDGARRYKEICSVISRDSFLNPGGAPKCPY